VSSVTRPGIGPPGFTREVNWPATFPPLTRTAPISVICAVPGVQPVVSTSTTTKSIASSGWFRSGASTGRAEVSQVITAQP